MTRKSLWRGAAFCFLFCGLACTLTGLPISGDSNGRIAQACLLLVVGLMADPAHAGPLMDPWLDRTDHLLGFDWSRIETGVAARPWLLLLLDGAYAANLWLPPAIILLLCGSERAERLYGMLRALGIAILLGLPLFFILPAEAAFTFYGRANLPANAQHYGALITALHGHRLTAIDLNDLGGIVTFPSFHAVMAILFAWALWPFRYLRAATLPICGLMWLAAIPIGGHYVVDVIGGSLLAWAAILLADVRWGTAHATPAPTVLERNPQPG